MNRRSAYTLLELIIALASASVLMVGLSSALFVAAQGLNVDQGKLLAQTQANTAIERLLAEVRTAVSVRYLSENSIEIDRLSEGGAVETLRYSLRDNSDNPPTVSLVRTRNGGTEAVVIPKLQSLSFEILTDEEP